jgi:hypothetical protein
VLDLVWFLRGACLAPPRWGRGCWGGRWRARGPPATACTPHTPSPEIKGSLTRDFRLQFFSRIGIPWAPAYSIGPFQICSKNSRRWSRMTSCSPVSTTPAIIPCHGFSVIAGVVDTDTGDNDTSEQLSPVTTTPVMCFKKIRIILMGNSGPTD